MASVASVLGDIPVSTGRVHGSTNGIDFLREADVSWAAIFAGAAAAAALSLILVVLGSGLGFSSVSPWSLRGPSGEALGVSAIVWLCITAVAASGLGGYLAGRLRTKWPALHVDEVYFRDTAHGFLAWAVATLITAGVLVSAIGSIVSTGATAAGEIAGAAAATGATSLALAPGITQGAEESRPSFQGFRSESTSMSPYLLDSLFRNSSASPTQSAGGAETAGNSVTGSADLSGDKVQVGRILANALRTGQLPPEDLSYASHLVAARTGLPQADAEKRVTDLYTTTLTKVRATETDAKNVADRVRKSTANALLWIFVSLLLGAFSASLMATFGGRRRDIY
jgi:hypothetical protein